MAHRTAQKRHAHMVDDLHRTAPLLRAIERTVRDGDLVLDIGTGTGILAIAAARAGAAHVWAIDVDREALAEAKRQAKRAGVDDRITFLPTLSFDLKLSERVDLVICETVGSFAFEENLLATLADATRRLLRKTGRIIPERVELWGCPIDEIPRLTRPNDIGRVKPESFLAQPIRLSSVSFRDRIPSAVHLRRQFVLEKQGVVKAIAVWPRVLWGKGEQTDASPLMPQTHWKQGVMPIEPQQGRPQQRLRFELIIEPDPHDPLRLTERLWKCQ